MLVVRECGAVSSTFVYKMPKMARRTTDIKKEPRRGGDSVAKATREETGWQSC